MITYLFMTEKQKNILLVALQLFAKEGFHATSTRQIAKLANVSEGLIFRHFTNKEGLLEAILHEGSVQIEELFAPIMDEEDPKKILCAILELPFTIDKSQHDFWRLIYTLKWQQNRYSHEASITILKLATKAFEKLGYKDPKNEALVLEMFLDGAATVLLLSKESHDWSLSLKAIKEKYNLI